MPIVAADLIVIGAVNHQETDAGTPQGGAQAKSKKIEFTDLAASDQIEILSSSASDVTQQYDIVGKTGAGADVTENLTLTGTTPVVTTATYERVNKTVRTAGAALVGTVTIQRDAAAGAISTFEPAASSKTGVDFDEFRKLFIAVVIPAVTDVFYEKVFFYNSHATLTLTTANIQLSDASDPSDTDLQLGLESTLDDTATSTNRLTAPSGPTFVDNQVNEPVANSQNHTAGAGQGCWIFNEVNQVGSAQKATFNLRETGLTV